MCNDPREEIPYPSALTFPTSLARENQSRFYRGLAAFVAVSHEWNPPFFVRAPPPSGFPGFVHVPGCVTSSLLLLLCTSLYGCASFGFSVSS